MSATNDDCYLTPKEVADKLRISVDSVYRMFEAVPGVVVLSKQKPRRSRTYRTMRIPVSAIDFFTN